MLWTDGYFVTQADLAVIDPEVPDVASVEAITVNGAGGIVGQTISECAMFIVANMQRFGGYLSSGLVSGNHLAAVFNTGGPGVNRTRIIMGQVVADDSYVPVVKQWVTYKALVNFYRAASARTLEERYKSKMEQFERDTRWQYWPNLKNIGIPVVYRPLAAPGAVLERGAGTWSSGNVSLATAAGATGGAFSVAITWVDQSQYLNQATLLNRGNAESAPSAVLAATPMTNQGISVNLSGLTPPNGAANPANLAQAITSPLTATAWNVWIGLASGGPMYLQNSTPIPITTTTYTLGHDPSLSGYTVGTGQYADNYLTVQDTVQRG